MPFLEQRWKPRPVAAPDCLKPCLNAAFPLLFFARHWTLCWCLLHVAGFLGGKNFFRLGGSHFPSPEPELQVFLPRLGGALILGLIRPRPATWWPSALAIVLLAGISGWQDQDNRDQRSGILCADAYGPSLRWEREGRAIVRTTGWPAPTHRGWKTTGVVLDADPHLDLRAGQGALLQGEEGAPQPGQVLALRAHWTVPPPGDLPGSFDYREFLAGRGITWKANVDRAVWLQSPSRSVRFLAALRTGMMRGLDRIVPPREAQLAGAVLLGARTPESREDARPFTDLGLAHLFAVSGLHVGVLLALVILPGTWTGLGPWARLVPVGLFLGLYILLTGLPGSVIRASGLGFLGLAAGTLGRKPRPLHLLGLLFWITTLAQPWQVLDPGVRLSYLAAGGILGAMEVYRTLPSLPGAIGGLWGGLQVSLAAMWATLPQAALSFGRFSLLSPVANLAAVPLFGLGVWAASLALVFQPLSVWVSESLGAWAFLIFRGLSGLVAWISRSSGGWNLGLAPTGPFLLSVWGVLCLLLARLMRPSWVPLRKTWPRSLLVLLILFLGHATFVQGGRQLLRARGPLVWQFDVGQGDCALIHFPDGANYLLDTGGVFGIESHPRDGPVSRAVIPFLKRAGVKDIQAVVLSHGHLDHTGGVLALNEAFCVGRFLTGGDADRDIRDWVPCLRVHSATTTDTLHSWQDWQLEILGSQESRPEGFHENDRSLVVALRRGPEVMMLWSGDLEQEGEAFLLERGEIPCGVQVWKAGHHGSNTSGSGAWLRRLAPRLIVASCGTGNKYGHPNHGPYTLGNDTVPLLRTDLEGSIRFSWDRKGRLQLKNGRGLTLGPRDGLTLLN